MLNTWLGGERSIGFCRFLSDRSSMLEPNEIPHCKYILTLILMLLVAELILMLLVAEATF